MKAIQIDGYKKGEVKVALRDVEMPHMGDHDVLIKVKAASILGSRQIRPVVGNVYSLDQAEAALREVAAGQKQGKVIIKL